ncbi:hypothetical protein A2619_03100 [candidate division WWE3 bacterium RIFOXYD1_FULL_39_9]|uniref:Bacterial Ig-like domain-containing protein n=1 Tax=candidate division WWE3 bacterium RIFOXYD1_FULL_39_9 TaxID=1802649 RepID=A0A1F4X938_UNCKA|nr:MAG: hypothetical protein A2619_03100 [candidate division WWE3 bacterium RIFOXYD1_FULL_39_9]
MATTRRTSQLKQEEVELQKRLLLSLMGIITIAFLLIIGVSFFAPQIGSFFGLFSMHRNDADDQAIIKPGPPTFSNVPNATKEEAININGFSQPGMNVVLYVNGPEVERALVGGDGLFTFSGIKLNKGKNTIYAKVVDSKGTESDTSKVYIISYDNEKPKIDVIEPKSGSTVKNLDKRIKITGKVNEKSSIKINGRLAIMKPDLSFEFLLGVEEGNVKIKVEATDEAGNVATEEFEVRYVKES